MSERRSDDGEPAVGDAVDAGEARDAELLAEIAAAVHETHEDWATPEIRERYRRSAQAAFTWRTIDQELADLSVLALIYDSATDDAALVRAADVDEPRQLSFASDALTLDVEVESGVLRGQLIPAGPGTATVQFGSGASVEVQADEDGMFSVERPHDAGPVRIRCRVGDVTLSTPWMPF